MTDLPKRIWAASQPCTVDGSGVVPLWAADRAFLRSTEYNRADLLPDLVRAALYKTRGYTWSGVEVLIADPQAIAAIVAQVVGEE